MFSVLNLNYKKMKTRLFIVMAIDHYNPLGLIRSLGEKGINPIYIAIKGKAPIASSSKYISECHYVDTVEEGFNLLLSKYGNYDAGNFPFLYCCDDKSLGYIDDRYDDLDGKFIFFNAGKNGQINKYIDKGEILNLAEKCGLRLAKTIVCNKGKIPADLEYPIITKSISPNVGGWKSDVFICCSAEDLKSAYEKIKSPQVLLQKYIGKKNELEYYGISVNHGNDVVMTIGTDYLYLILGYYSPYMNVFNPPYPEVQKKIAEMLKEIGFEGIFSCEFIVDENDELYFLEINFRNATWSYSSTCSGNNLPYLWAESMLNGVIDRNKICQFEPFKAMVEPIDYAKRVREGKTSVIEWATDFKEAKCTYYYNQEDLEPFNVMCNNFEKLG